MVIAEPEIRSFAMQSTFDFILIGCDGIFDRLSNREVVDSVWEAAIDMARKKRGTIHQAVADAVELVLRQAAASRSLDNITVLILGF